MTLLLTDTAYHITWHLTAYIDTSILIIFSQ